MHPWVKETQVCWNKGFCPFQWGDNYEIAKIHWRNKKKIFFSLTTGPISSKLGAMHPWVKATPVCSNDGSYLFPRGDNLEIASYTLTKFKISSSQEKLDQFQLNLAQGILGWRGFKCVNMKGPVLFQGKIITK